MRVMCVDDEPVALSSVRQALDQVAEVTDVAGFLSPLEALAYVSEHPVDVAILDIDMYEMDGLSLARRIRERSSHTAVIFLTAYAAYALDAFQVHASGYLLKPVSCEDIEEELQCLRKPVTQPAGKRVRVQCFGNFEVFVDGRPLKFRRSRTKELFAYLVDRRGSAVNTGELCAVLWEDRPDSISLKNQLRTLLSDLTRSLREAGAEKVLVKRRNFFAVAVDEISCDYYDLLRRRTSAVNSYTGEYMSQYAWAEMTLGILERN